MTKKIDLFYDKFSIIYPLVDLFLKPQKRKLFEEINRLPSGKILEIGVGTGTHLKLYSNTHKITGIDTSLKMLDIAKKHNNKHVKFLQMDGEQLSFNDSFFDYIVLSHIISVVNNPEKLLEETHRVLKPDGNLFILNHFTPNNWLKYIDKSFSFFSNIFRFKSFFYAENLSTLKKFMLQKEIHIGTLSYFKLLIYKKV